MNKTLPNLLLILLIICSSVTGYSQQPENLHPKLLLLCKGLVNDTLKNVFTGMLEADLKDYKTAIIVNASSSEKKKNKKFRKVRHEFADLGFDTLNIIYFDVKKQDPHQLQQSDIIYILGGNPFLLLKDLHDSGADTIIRRLAFADKIIMGYSAGSLVLGPDLEQMQYVDSLLGFNEMNYKNLECIGLYDFTIFPHYREFIAEVKGLEEAISKYETICRNRLYRLNDNQAILYRDGNVKVVGN